jgi:hypothetical protein
MASFFGNLKAVNCKYRDALTILNWCNRLLQRTVKTSMSALRTSLFIGSLVLFMARATTSPAQAAKPAPPTPIDLKKAELGGRPWNPEWDQIIEKALPPEMLSSQAPQGRPSILPAILRDGLSRQTHILGLLLPGACRR